MNMEITTLQIAFWILCGFLLCWHMLCRQVRRLLQHLGRVLRAACAAASGTTNGKTETMRPMPMPELRWHHCEPFSHAEGMAINAILCWSLWYVTKKSLQNLAEAMAASRLPTRTRLAWRKVNHDLVTFDADQDVYLSHDIDEIYEPINETGTSDDAYAFTAEHETLGVYAGAVMATGVQSAVTRKWSVTRRWWNRLMHSLHGNGPTCSSTWPWHASDSPPSDVSSETPLEERIHSLYMPGGWAGRQVQWMPEQEEIPMAQDWEVTFQCNLCGEPLQVRSVQHATIGRMIQRAAQSLIVPEASLVAIEAGDILSHKLTIENIERLDIDFHIDGGGGSSASNQPPRARSRSRTPARPRSAAAEAAEIEPDFTAYVDDGEGRAFLVVLKSVPKGRRCYPLYVKLDQPIATLRWEFGRVARRGVTTFTFWQNNRQFHDDELIEVIDRAAHLEVWKAHEPADEAPDLPAPPRAVGEGDPDQQERVVVDPYMCPDCVELTQRVDHLHRRVTFIEELLEMPAHRRLRGGGKKGEANGTPRLPDCYEAVLKRCLQHCPQLAKQQVKLLLKADVGLCQRLSKTDNPSLIRILTAASKRAGMSPGVHSEAGSPTDEPSGKKPAGVARTPSTPPTIILGDADKTTDEESIPVLTLESLFNVPTVSSLRPGESGILLGEGEDLVTRMLERFAGSQGAAALVTPARYSSVPIEPLEMPLQFKKEVKDQPAVRYTCLAYVYRLTATTPELKQETPVVKLQPTRKSVVMGVEVIDVRGAAADLYTSLAHDQPDYALVKKHLTQLMGDSLAPHVLECFLAKRCDTSIRLLARVSFAVRDQMLAHSGHNAVFWSPELSRKDQFAVIWLPSAEAEDHREALRAAQKVTNFGTVTRLDKSGERRYGLRVKASDKDRVAKELGKPTGARYFIRGAPIEWIEADIMEFAKQLKWDISIPNPVTAVRIRKGVASWAVRSVTTPPVQTAVVVSGDEKVTLQLTAVDDAKPKPVEQGAGPPRSWASIVASNVKTGAKTTDHLAEDKQNPKKRKAAVESRPKSEPPAAARHKSVSFAAPEAKSSQSAEAESVQSMMKALMLQVKEMQVQLTGLNTRMGSMENTVSGMMHEPEDDDIMG